MTAADYIGIKSGRLRLLGRPPPTWKKAFAQCSCGEVVQVKLADFLRGHIKSCRGFVCRAKENLIGKTFGQLRVVRLGEKPGKGRKRRYVVTCICGRSIEVASQSLQNGNTTSCGCRRKKVSRAKVAAQSRQPNGRFFRLTEVQRP